MNEDINYLLLIANLVIGASLGFMLAWIRAQKKQSNLQQQLALLAQQLENNKKQHEENARHWQQSTRQLQQAFNELTTEALNRNNEAFLRLANEKFSQFHIKANNELNKKEKSFETLIDPIKQALEKTEQQVRFMEKERKESWGALQKHLEGLSEAQKQLQGETRNLVQAFKRPEVRGRWGEITLKRLTELAGMVEHCDFFEQPTTETDNGNLRPDMVVRLPGGRDIVVDIKTPLDAYLSATEQTEDEAKQRELQRHARHVRERMKELASKAYWNQFENAPDFVVLFIPGEQFLTAALEIDYKLLEDAMSNRVILSTPTSFVALLRAVAYGWRQESLTENAERIQKTGEELYQRLATFAEHLSKLGKSLDNSVSHYNRAVASFDTRVLPGAKKFTEMGIHDKKEIPAAEPIEKRTRQRELDTLKD